MATSTCFAFLQAHARRIDARPGAGAGFLFGTKVGTWRIRTRCRKAASSTTYRVAHEQSGEQAALTVFDTPALALGSYTRRILSVAQMLTKVDHPGVVSIIDAGLVADGRPYVVSELDEGVTLAMLAQDEQPMEHHSAVTILRGICAALMAAHEVGVVHGSLDLEQVFLTEGDVRFVKLLDWGVERAVFDEARRAGIEPATRASCTAPEQVVGIVSPKTDAYALGVVAHQLLYRVPVDAGSAHEMTATRSMSPALGALLVELVEPDPRARPTIREAADRLAAVARDLETRPAGEPWSPSPGALDDELVPDLYARAQIPTWVSAVAAAGVICTLLSVFVIGRDDDAPVAAQASLSTATTPASVAPPFAAREVPPVASPRPPIAVVTPPVARPAIAVAPPAIAVAPPAIAVAPPAIAAPTRQAPPVREPQRARLKPASNRAAAPAANKLVSDVRTELLTQYQRIGHDLIELRKQRGAEAIADLWHRFSSLKIHHALGTSTTRAQAAATLGELRVKIDRNKRLQPSAACLGNPLAEGCR